MKERLQKILSGRGLCSRREAEKWIEAGRVTVNGLPAELGAAADPEQDHIMVDGHPLPGEGKLVYLMLHKPRGYVTTLRDEKGRPDAASLVADCGVRVYPIGRLDMDSEGLLLFTNDGDFANRLMHPSHEIEKCYRVLVFGFEPGKEEQLARPIVLDGYKIHPPKVRLLEARDGKARLEVVIHEGRNRQVRRMCQAAGMQVLRLKRVAEGPLGLGSLPEGKWRYLTEPEIRELKK